MSEENTSGPTSTDESGSGLNRLRFHASPRACRIVCTIGPASNTPEVLEELIESGMNVARLNFSHGSHETHRKLAVQIRAAAAKTGRPVALLQDLQGHKVRVGRTPDPNGVELSSGQEVTVGFGTEIDAELIGVDYETLAEHVERGHRLFLDDAQIELETIEVTRGELLCRVREGGILKNRKGVIFPDSRLDFPLINDKDLDDAKFGAELGVDMIAMSFVRSAREIEELRHQLASWGMSDTTIIAKIEDSEGVENLELIIDEADGVLIARGDLGVTLPREKVPGLQKAILRKARARGVPSITATQMLESMTYCDKPTRAEVSDVYGAVLDGSDAVMLSGETAAGDYPIHAVREMDRICREAEREQRVLADEKAYTSPVTERDDLYDKIAASAAALAHNLQARCILAFSASGSLLKALSAARPRRPVHGAVGDPNVLRRLLIHRALSLVHVEAHENRTIVLRNAIAKLRSDGAADAGDRVVVLERQAEPGTRETYHLKLAILD